jgi:hypothetical protein
MQRFQMFAWPDVTDWKHVDRWPDTEAKRTAWAVFGRLADVKADTLGARITDQGAIPSLGFCDGAQDLFDGWYSDLNKRARAGEMPSCLEAHISKYVSLMPSLALLIHLANGGFGQVTKEAAFQAAAWCNYLESHARRLYAPGIVGDELAARELARRIAQGAFEEKFTLRELYRKHWGSLSTPEEAQAAIEVLVECNWLIPTSVCDASGGRPTTEYLINPRAREAVA